MAAIVGEITLENKQLKAKLAESVAEVRNMKAQMMREGQGIGAGLASGMKGALGNLAGVIGLPLGIGAVVVGLKSMAERFDSMEDSASAMNATVEGVQRLSYMAAGTTTPLEQMTRGLLNIKRALFEVDDEAKQKALANIGIDAAKFMNLDADQAFIQLATSFQEAQRDGKGFAEVFELMKKVAPDLIPALRTSADELKRMGDNAVVSAEQVRTFTENLGKAKIGGIEFTNTVMNGVKSLGDALSDVEAGLLGMFDNGPGFWAAGVAHENERVANAAWDAVDADEQRLKLSKAETEEAQKRKAIIDAERAAKDAEAASRQAVKDKKSAESVTGEEQDVRIKELRAGGHGKQADKLERLQKGQKEFQRLRDAHPEMGEEWALQMAHRKDEAEHMVPGRIHGYKGRGGSKPGEGLDWLYGHNREKGGQAQSKEFKFPALDEMNRKMGEVVKLLGDK